MTPEQFKQHIQTPEGLIAFVLDNNLPAVNERIVSMGISKDPLSPDEAYNVIQDLANTGKLNVVKHLLSVPARADADNPTVDYLPLVFEVAMERAKKQKQNAYHN